MNGIVLNCILSKKNGSYIMGHRLLIKLITNK